MGEKVINIKDKLTDVSIDTIGKLCPNCTCVYVGPTVGSDFRFCPKCGEKVHDVRVIA